MNYFLIFGIFLNIYVYQFLVFYVYVQDEEIKKLFVNNMVYKVLSVFVEVELFEKVCMEEQRRYKSVFIFGQVSK